MCVQQVSVCTHLRRTHSSCHYVGTKPLYNRRKIINSTTRHDAPSGVQSVRRRVATVALTFATPHRAVHVLVTNMSFVRDLKKVSVNKVMNYKIVSTLEIALPNIHRMYSYFRIGGGPSLEQSGLSFCVPSFWSPFIPHPLLLFHLESSSLRVRDLLHVLTLRESDVPEKLPDSSVPEPRCPEAGLTGQHPEFILLSPWFHTWEQLVLTRLLGYSKDFVPQSRFPRDATSCTCFHLHKQIRWRSFLEIFTSERIRAQI